MLYVTMNHEVSKAQDNFNSVSMPGAFSLMLIAMKNIFVCFCLAHIPLYNL